MFYFSYLILPQTNQIVCTFIMLIIVHKLRDKIYFMNTFTHELFTQSFILFS